MQLPASFSRTNIESKKTSGRKIFLGEKLKVVSCEDEHGEADEIAKLIREFANKDTKYSDIALFYRTNAQSRVLEISLRNYGIPYIIIGGVEFYQRKEIKDILSYLRLCINPHDEVALERIINTPTRGIGNTTVKKLADWAASQGTGLFNAVRNVDVIPDIKGKTPLLVKKIFRTHCKFTAIAKITR